MRSRNAANESRVVTSSAAPSAPPACGGEIAVEVADRHACPAGHERTGRREADPAPASGHDDDTLRNLTLRHRAAGYRPALAWTGKRKDCSRAWRTTPRATRGARCSTSCTTTACRVDELRQAVAEQRLALLPVERLLASEARYTARDIAEQSGLDLEWFQAQRRALGLAVPDPDERVYGETDLESAELGRQYREVGLPEEDAMEAQRVLGRGHGALRRVGARPRRPDVPPSRDRRGTSWPTGSSSSPRS